MQEFFEKKFDLSSKTDACRKNFCILQRIRGVSLAI